MTPLNHFENYHGWNVISQTPFQQDEDTYYRVVFEKPLSQVEEVISHLASIVFGDGYGFEPKKIEVINKQSVEMYLVSLIESYKPIQKLYKKAMTINNQETGHDVQIKLADGISCTAYTNLKRGSISLGFGVPFHKLLVYLVFELTNVTSSKELKQAIHLEKEAYVRQIELVEFNGVKKCNQLFREAIQTDVWNPQLCNGIKEVCDESGIGPNDHFDWEKVKNSNHADRYRERYDSQHKSSNKKQLSDH